MVGLIEAKVFFHFKIQVVTTLPTPYEHGKVILQLYTEYKELQSGQ